MVYFPFLSFFRCRSRKELAWDEEAESALAALGFTTDGRKESRTQRGKDKSDEREVRELGLPQGCTLSCVCVCVSVLCCPSTSLPESAVYVEWVWGLHACTCVFLLCVWVCLCLFSSLAWSHRRQVKNDHPVWVTCCTLDFSIAFISPSLSLFSTHIHFCVLKTNPRATLISMYVDVFLDLYDQISWKCKWLKGIFFFLNDTFC